MTKRHFWSNCKEHNINNQKINQKNKINLWKIKNKFYDLLIKLYYNIIYKINF